MSDTVPQPMRILKPSAAATTPASGTVENTNGEALPVESDVSSALEGLSLDSDKATSKANDAAKSVSSGPENESTETKSDEPLAAGKPELAPQKSSSAVSESSDEPASLSTEATDEPQLVNGVPAYPVDHPDPRLISALENPRDRLFVIKLEKTVLEFIGDESLESIDLPPTNSYHRLLTHKMAEYYRLTHLADAAGTSVRIFRGQAARIPPTKLANWPVSLLQQQQKPSTGSAPAVRIMRRSPPSDGKGSSRRKDGSEASSENEGPNGSSAKTSREEREAAYQQARARIFKDFVESPPETPPPANEKKSKRRDHNDDEFSSRSAFFAMSHPIPPQMYYPQQQQQQQYPDTSNYMMPQQAAPAMPTMPYNSMMPSFNPSAPAYSPSANNSYQMTPQRQQYPSPVNPYNTPDRSVYPQQPQPQQQPLYPQYPLHGQTSPQQMRQTPGYGYPGQQQHQPTTPNNTYSQPLRPPMMQSSYSSNGTPPYHNQNLTPPHAAPPQMNRQQFPPLPGQVNPYQGMQQQQSQPQQRVQQQQQQQQQQLSQNGYGWPANQMGGGVPMNSRSSSAPGIRPGEMGGYPQSWGQQQGMPVNGSGVWNGASARGGMSAGMNGAMNAGMNGAMNGMHHGGLGPMHGMKANGMGGMGGGMGAGGMNGMRM